MIGQQYPRHKYFFGTAKRGNTVIWHHTDPDSVITPRKKVDNDIFLVGSLGCVPLPTAPQLYTQVGGATILEAQARMHCDDRCRTRPSVLRDDKETGMFYRSTQKRCLVRQLDQ